ncbi:MAG: dephospho-CoA kinase [Acidobacteriota bacterium]|jgi:dephospho-CoA kinase|nr:dephospho-CoA kinase [Acidobacteriota bacterium]MDQ3373374.1 dephospho-CoA kinase [Acidobacteriota bacterium]
MLKVGLTGSIAVGKSYVCDVFRGLGAFVLDADQTAREVVEPNTKGLKEIVEQFGVEVLQPSGELDRAKLGAIVFTDTLKRELLNSIVHPLVNEKQNEWMREQDRGNSDAICIIDAALMIESGGWKRFDKIIVVWCESAIQLKRLMLRNNLSTEQALFRINSQMPQEEKKQFADFLIDTTQGFESAKKQTNEIFNQLKLL